MRAMDWTRYNRKGKLLIFPIDESMAQDIRNDMIFPWKLHIPAENFAPNPTPRWVSHRAEFLSWYAKQPKPEYYHDLWEYEEEMYAKMGFQGGPVPDSVLRPLFERYYTHVNFHVPWEMVWARKVLCDMVERKVKQVGKAVNGYVSLPNTKAKFPFGGVKNDAINGSQPEWAEGCYGPLYPAQGGHRYQRQKPRTIFMDSSVNVARVQRILNAARIWFRDNFPDLYSTWRRDQENTIPWIRKMIGKRRWFMEGDYEAMDTHMCLDAARFILPYYKAVLPEDDYVILADYVEYAFTQPLVWANEIWTGLHNLFSGEPITNDFETHFSITLQTAIILALRLRWGELRALGDDTILATSSYESAAIAAKWFKALAEQCGQKVNTQKLRISRVPRFLRRTHFERHTTSEEVQPGAYPAPLFFNSVFFPEYPQKNKADGIVAILQACDNFYGHPSWGIVIPKIFSLCVDRTGIDNPADTTPKDWWYKLYGEKWNPESSVSVKLLKNVNLWNDSLELVISEF